jgi:hypothetical protein
LLSLGISGIKSSAKLSPTSSGLRKANPKIWCKEYKKNVTDISKWLHHIFGLAFLNPEDVGDSFAEDLIPDMPSDNKVQDFGDYVVSTYVDDNA